MMTLFLSLPKHVRRVLLLFLGSLLNSHAFTGFLGIGSVTRTSPARIEQNIVSRSRRRLLLDHHRHPDPLGLLDCRRAPPALSGRQTSRSYRKQQRFLSGTLSISMRPQPRNSDTHVSVPKLYTDMLPALRRAGSMSVYNFFDGTICVKMNSVAKKFTPSPSRTARAPLSLSHIISQQMAEFARHAARKVALLNRSYPRLSAAGTAGLLGLVGFLVKDWLEESSTITLFDFFKRFFEAHGFAQICTSDAGCFAGVNAVWFGLGSPRVLKIADWAVQRAASEAAARWGRFLITQALLCPLIYLPFVLLAFDVCRACRDYGCDIAVKEKVALAGAEQGTIDHALGGESSTHKPMLFDKEKPSFDDVVDEIARNFLERYPNTLLTTLALWSPIDAVRIWKVPPPLQLQYMAVAGFLWNIVLAMAVSKSSSSRAEQTDNHANGGEQKEWSQSCSAGSVAGVVELRDRVAAVLLGD